VWPWLKWSFSTHSLLHKCLPYKVRPTPTPCCSNSQHSSSVTLSLQTHISFTQNYSFFSCLDYWEALNLALDVFLLKLQNMLFLIWRPKTLFILVPYDMQNINKTPFLGRGGGGGEIKVKHCVHIDTLLILPWASQTQSPTQNFSLLISILILSFYTNMCVCI